MVASNAEFSNTSSLTHLRHVWKSSFFPAINRSGSSSLRAKVAEKVFLTANGTFSYNRLDPPGCPGAHCPICSCFLWLIFGLSEKLSSASMHTRVYLPRQLSLSPREAGGKPRYLRDSRRLEKESFLSLDRSAVGLQF